MIESSIPIDHSKQNPTLRTVNGVGFRLTGWMKDPINPMLYYKVHWFTFIFIPILPLGIYALHKDQSSYPNYTIFGRVNSIGFMQKFGMQAVALLVTSFIESGIAITIFSVIIIFAALLKSGLHQAFR